MAVMLFCMIMPGNRGIPSIVAVENFQDFSFFFKDVLCVTVYRSVGVYSKVSPGHTSQFPGQNRHRSR